MCGSRESDRQEGRTEEKERKPPGKEARAFGLSFSARDGALVFSKTVQTILKIPPEVVKENVHILVLVQLEEHCC